MPKLFCDRDLNQLAHLKLKIKVLEQCLSGIIVKK